MTRAGLVLIALLLPLFSFAQEISGTLPDGTPWRAVRPDNWNGVLTLDLDFARSAAPPPTAPRTTLQQWMLAQGYAMGGITREPVGYDFARAVQYLLTVREQFAQHWGSPRLTLAMGNSRGAFVARKAIELHPEVFKGALVSSGGGAGSIAVLNSKLDTVWALRTLVDPASPLRLVDIPPSAQKEEEAALAALLGKANASPQGRARLALALAFEQFPAWSSRGKPKPVEDDYDAQLDQAVENFTFANPAVVRMGVEKVAGGNVSWNTGVDYAKLLEKSGQRTKVQTLYRRAGLNLKDDLRRLARAPRIAVNATALARAEPLTTYTGKIGGPVVNVDNDDPVDPAPLKLAYLDTLRRAGNGDQLRILWSDGAGHGGQTDLDRVVGLKVLMRRIETGRWGDTRLAALKALAAETNAAAGGALGTDTLFEPKVVAPLRTWDAGNWRRHAHDDAKAEHHHRFDDPEQYARSWDDPARDAWQKPAALVAALGVQPGMAVADIGTGTGYLLPYLSRAAGPTGRVHAVDVEPKMLDWVAGRARREGLSNVTTVLAQGGASGLPPASVDRAIMINVWHHIEDPAAYSRDMARVLRPGGVLFIVEARPDVQESDGPPAHMRLPPQKIIAQLQAAGLTASVDALSLDRQYVVRATR